MLFLLQFLFLLFLFSPISENHRHRLRIHREKYGLLLVAFPEMNNYACNLWGKNQNSSYLLS